MHQIVKIGLLIGLAVVSFVIGVIIASLESKTCLSGPCKTMSILVSNSLNTSVDPCQNFYKFACGNYNTYNGTTPGRITDIRSALEVLVLKEAVRALETSIKGTDDVVVRIAKSFYLSCSDYRGFDHRRFGGVFHIIKRYFPLIDDDWMEKEEKTFSSVNSEATLFKLGFVVGAFIELEVKYYNDVLKLFINIPQDTTRADDFNDTLQFYIDMYEAITYSDPPDDKLENLKSAAKLKVAVSKVKRDYPRKCPVAKEIVGSSDQFEDLGHFDNLKKLGSFFPFVKSQDIHIAIGFIEYIRKIDKLLTEMKPFKQAAANFIVLESLTRVQHLLPKEVRDSYDKYLKGDNERNDVIINDKKLHCAQLVNNLFPNHLATYYLEANKAQVAYDRDVRSLIDSLKIGMVKKLKKSTWLSKDDKSKAISKVKKIKIVTPFTRNNIKFLTTSLYKFEREKSANFCAGTSLIHEFLKVRVLSHHIMKNLARSYDVYTTDISFRPEESLIVLPIIYLSFPLIDKFWPKYISFGVMGSRLARAMWKSLGFDIPVESPENYKGFDYFYDGYDDYDNEPDTDSEEWSEKTMTAYSERRKCILAEYNDLLYQYIGRNISNIMCIAQLPSNTMGVHSAYVGYREYHKSRFYNEPSLPYLNQYSNDQHFFIDVSTYYCKKQIGTYNENMTDYEIVSFSNEFQLNQMLRNNVKFVEAFNCKKGDYMNSAKKCSLI